MKPCLALLVLLLVAPLAEAAGDCPPILDHRFKALAEDRQVHLCEEYAGKVILVVNTASKCGYTYQYEGLEALYRQYRDRGLVVLGFPSNDFGGQEPGTEQQIQTFCRLTYSVQFPMFEKTPVAEHHAHPLFQALADATGGYPQWNFHKYLIGRDGTVVAGFGSRVEPDSRALVGAIERLLDGGG